MTGTPRFTWQHRFTATRTIGRTRTTVTAGLHHLQGNDRPYFTVTCDIEEQARNNRWVDSSGGSPHDAILAAFPQLAPVVALHLADDHGVPMHAVANALYHLGFGRSSESPYAWEHFKAHLRVDEDEAQRIQTLLLDAAPGERESALSNYIASHLASRWQAEADAAVAVLDGLIATTS